MRLEYVRTRLGNVRPGNVRARLGTVSFGNVKLRRSFSVDDKAKHLQLHLPGPDGNTIEHQQLRRSWLEDNRFGMYQAEEGLLLGLAELKNIAEGSGLKE